MAENGIGDEGAISISEVLKVNTTLTTVCLTREDKKKRIKRERMKNE